MMKIRNLLLAATCAGLLAACGDNPGGNGATQEAAAAKAELGQWGVDLSARDESVKPGDDFFRYANGTWLKTYELKPDQARYGSFLVLRDRSEERVKAIIEDLAKQEAAPGSIEQMIGDYFASFMDTERLNALGVEPLKPDLERIAAIASKDELIKAFAR
ncbi:MAG: M13 family peptidase, partial [Rhodothalassiaceae bacterium]